MTPLLLYRPGRACMDRDELAAAERHFSCVRSRMQIGAGKLVIGRYSVLPFYKELEDDVIFAGSRLVNSHSQHQYVADLQNWVMDLGDLTPATWSRLEDLPEEGPFVLKGATNSKKFEWRTHMFARDRREAGEVHSRLCNDGLIGTQEVYIRKYVPLVTYVEAPGGLPITREFRFFVAYGEIVSGGFYWSSNADEVADVAGAVPSPEEVPASFLREVIRRVGDRVNFYALDVAQAASGEWIVIELNDGQMSGLSMNEPETLYAGLRRVLDARGR